MIARVRVSLCVCVSSEQPGSDAEMFHVGDSSTHDPACHHTRLAHSHWTTAVHPPRQRCPVEVFRQWHLRARNDRMKSGDNNGGGMTDGSGIVLPAAVANADAVTCDPSSCNRSPCMQVRPDDERGPADEPRPIVLLQLSQSPI
eukprot:GHVU01103955.1.p1 GENE.GHVU01103955.1~~GHVU01103955.1.p1  ORF type:complete len:144 (+),score=7.13 GHVU01103955.1:1111-1542(+)